MMLTRHVEMACPLFFKLIRGDNSVSCILQVHARGKNNLAGMLLSAHKDSKDCVLSHNLTAKRMNIMYCIEHMSHKQASALLKHTAVTIDTAITQG